MIFYILGKGCLWDMLGDMPELKSLTTRSLCILKRKTFVLALPTSSYNWNINRRASLFPRIDAKNIDREVQPKRSSFSGKMEVAKPFLCSKLSSKSC